MRRSRAISGENRPARRSSAFETTRRGSGCPVTKTNTSAQDEAFRQRIVRREKKLASPADPGAAFDLGHDRVAAFPAQVAHGTANEARADDALDDERLPRLELASRALDCDAAGHAGAGRRAVDLALGEVGDVAGVVSRGLWRSGEDRSREKGLVVLPGVPDLRW